MAAATSAIAAVVDEHKKTDVGLGRPDQPLAHPTRRGDSSVATLSQVSAHSRGLLGGNTDTVVADDSVSQFAGAADDGVSFGWGHLAKRYGIYEAESNIAFGRMVCSYTSQQQLPKGTFCLAPYAFENHGRTQKQLVHHPQDRALGRRWRAGTAP